MARYYFFLRGDVDVADAEGTELPDLDAARKHAVTVAHELMFRRDGMLDRDWSRWTMSVRDSDGQELLSFALVEFGDVPAANGP